jgi:hypothetical protein
MGNAPNHFFDSPDSTTSRIPGLSASIVGTWLARLLCGGGVKDGQSVRSRPGYRGGAMWSLVHPCGAIQLVAVVPPR